ncbi:hypothetical protein SAY87_030093 [Trapa incisa]|uniref:non-specific serine/threonine protein kinase n=1 Tax=Trapa incisa TaxID=236973 RepID=A0AAN7KC51_9MYRT|nr:hypothetical protein SAY87_030093 [Trapa incisa]
MSSEGSLNGELLKKTPLLGLKLWVLIGITVGSFIILILGILSAWITFRKRSKRTVDESSSHAQIPNVSKEIRVDSVGARSFAGHPESISIAVNDKSSDKSIMSKWSDPDNLSHCSSINRLERGGSSHSGEEGGSGTVRRDHSSLSYAGLATASPLIGLPEVSHLGWGHWFTLRDLEVATDRFSADNVIGEGGYGVVYRGRLVNGTEVAVKKLLNYLGQAGKEFQAEVEAIGHVRHKNLVRLLGYCIEGIHRMLVYEFVNNGNLDQWLHGSLRQHGSLTWEARMKVILGTAKALAYIHEGIEPKVVHRDIKSSNILIDDEFNAKVSDFGLAKIIGSNESHVATRVMGTFGYVAPEYANTGLLNEKSDVYSFGVLLLESITGREPVDYGRPANEVNLVEWLKMMVGTKRADEVVDPSIEVKPPTRSLKRALVVAIRCVDLEWNQRPRMTQVVRMLEADEFPSRQDRRSRKNHATSNETRPTDTCGSNEVQIEAQQ